VFEAQTLLIAGCLFLGAILYTSVGHAGASAYIAVMTLFDLPPAVIRPTALTLNIFVSSFTALRYIKSNFFNKTLFLFLIIGSVPAAFIGGRINLPSNVYKPVIGVLLLLSGLRFLIQALQTDKAHREVNKPSSNLYGRRRWFVIWNYWHRRRHIPLPPHHLVGLGEC